MAYKVFTNGSPLPASDLNTYLMNQSVMVFADSAARSAALSSPSEGMLTYLESDNKLYYYNGSWVDLASSPIQSKTANYTIVASDAASTIFVNSSSEVDITIANVLAPGQRIDFVQKGTGVIEFIAGSGVTLNSAGGVKRSNGQYTAQTVICEASGTYYLIGNIKA